MLLHLISLATPNVTSSPASVDGASPSEWQDGKTVARSGPAPALANLSAKQARERGLMTSGTYGPIGSTLSGSASLQSSLVSRLQTQLNTGGSILFKMTWREKATPAGRFVYRLVASPRPTSDNAFGSWPTSRTQDARHAAATEYELNKDEKYDLLHVKANRILAGWTTTTTRDHKDGSSFGTVPINGLLGRQVWLTGSPVQMANGGQLRPGHSRWIMGYPAAWDYFGVTETPSFLKLPRKSFERICNADPN